MYYVSPWQHEFVSAMFNFFVAFNNLQLNDTEIGLFSAVVLLTNERSGLYDSKAIDAGQGRLCEALRLQAGRNHPGDPGLSGRALSLLGPLRALGLAHARHLAWLRPHWGTLSLPPLFAEIFDIPTPQVVVGVHGTTRIWFGGLLADGMEPPKKKEVGLLVR